MEYKALLFSIFFFIISVVYIFFGLYIISLNPKAKLNRIFFGICIALFFWAFGFSVAISAPEIKMCLLWRRVSALGWGTLYSMLLHFNLVLTKKDGVLKKWWSYVLLYLPSVIIVFVFAVFSDMAILQYNLINTDYGWTNISVNNAWDWFFNIYYISYTIFGLGLVLLWGRKSCEDQIKKQANIVFFSFIIALFLGTLTDIVINTYFSIVIPQMAPAVIMIPIIAILYLIKRYHFMGPEIANKDEIILNQSTRGRIYDHLAISFIAGSFLNFVTQYFINEQAELGEVLSFSALIIFAGVIIKIISGLRIEENYKDIINITIISLIIPIVTLNFIELASITVWAFSFIIIIFSLVFNNRIVLLTVSVSIFATQLFVWLMTPQVMVRIDGIDHIVRIGLFAIAIWLAFYVNKIYIFRLKENADKIKLQKLIAEISSDFVAINQINFDEKINNMLKQSGEFCQVERSYVFLFDLQNRTMTYTHEWCQVGTKQETCTIRNISLDVFPWWIKQIELQGIIHIADVKKLPVEALEEIKQLVSQETKSLISLPITSKGKVLGFLVFDSAELNKKWRDDHINLLKIITNVLADAIAKVEAEKEINFMAYYDQLTKLPNRFLFNDRVNQAIHLANRTEKMIGIIFLDLDSFKTVNDTMGHELGDELLQIVGHKISQCLRKSDTVSRFGGDEFIIMANNISNIQNVVKVAEKITSLFKQPFNLQGQDFYITVSIGVAVYPFDGEDTETLIKNADIAMYNAKDKGRNQYVLCTKEMKEDILNKMKLTNNLYRAMERNELFIYYQPQIDLISKKIIGLEALLRWEHPELGMVAPDIFIPLAEKTGLINPIGEWVLRTACLKNKTWQNQGLPPVRIAVNISVNQFRNPNFTYMVDNILIETGLKPEYLELEITESIAIHEFYYIFEVLNELKKLGVYIAIDDFGTEYSSLSRLKLLPIDRIKMDIQFVRSIEISEKDRAITKVIINLAKDLGLKVIAEGVENERQLEFLSQRMCDEIQGFYYYKPMPADEVERVLKESGNDNSTKQA